MLKSERLLQIAHRVLKHLPLADIGSDHALLPCYLVSNDVVPSAIAVEVNEGPFDSAKRHVKEWGLNGRIDVRLGDGLTVIEPGEVASVVIAGMGGSLIADILSNGKQVLQVTKRLVLQPNVAADTLRQWMLDEGWQLIDEELVFENGHYYEILVAEPGPPHIPYEAADAGPGLPVLLEVGPLLWHRRHPLLRPKWEREIAKWEHILAQMPQIHEKRSKMESRIHNWKEMIACLPRENTSSAFSNSTSRRI